MFNKHRIKGNTVLRCRGFYVQETQFSGVEDSMFNEHRIRREHSSQGQRIRCPCSEL